MKLSIEMVTKYMFKLQVRTSEESNPDTKETIYI